MNPIYESAYTQTIGCLKQEGRIFRNVNRYDTQRWAMFGLLSVVGDEHGPDTVGLVMPPYVIDYVYNGPTWTRVWDI